MACARNDNAECRGMRHVDAVNGAIAGGHLTRTSCWRMAYLSYRKIDILTPDDHSSSRKDQS
jgi:hypothetical protein